MKNKLKNKANIFYWTLFDFANTSYSIIIVTFLYAVYFKETIAQGKPIGDFYWSLGISISMIITGIIAPILGAIADYSAGKKRFLLFFTLLCIISSASLYFTKESTIALGLLLFIIANIGFEAGLVFYDAFLPEITEQKNYGRVSGYGFAMGYLGSLIILAILFPFIQQNLIKVTFPISALFFLVFSLPMFLFVHDKKNKKVDKVNYIKVGLNRVKFTLMHIRNYKNLVYFLLAFFLYIEGVNTVIFFSGNYAKSTLNFSFQELALFFIIVQTTAILGSVIFGVISDSIGQKKSIIMSLVIWIITMLIAYLTSADSGKLIDYLIHIFQTDLQSLHRNSFYMVGLLAGAVMGATQSTSRSLMSKLTPDDKKTEFFGFYSLFGKSSAVVGPLVFGYISYITANQRYGILSILFFFIAGIILLTRVQD